MLRKIESLAAVAVAQGGRTKWEADLPHTKAQALHPTPAPFWTILAPGCFLDHFSFGEFLINEYPG